MAVAAVEVDVDDVAVVAVDALHSAVGRCLRALVSVIDSVWFCLVLDGSVWCQ